MAFDPNLVPVHFPALTSVSPIMIGGQKTVFKANHPTHGQIVLKVFEPSLDQEETAREILAVAQINSARVPAIFEHGSFPVFGGECSWLFERYIEGGSLRQTLNAGPLSLTDAILMTRHVLEALCSAEAVQIVHRDVKPDNIMRDAHGNYWLIDFGIARHLNLVSITATANPFGKLTIGYAPSEQIRNSKPLIDSRSDLFALGVTLIESITGSNPFNSPPCGQFEMLNRVENQPLAVDFGPGQKSVELAKFAATLTQKRRDLRPRTAGDAMVWLESINVLP